MTGIAALFSILALSAGAFAQPSGGRPVTAEERGKIESAVNAIPAKPPATPRKPRRLLVIAGVNNRILHSPVLHTNLAVELMGARTGAYQTVVSFDSSPLAPGSLKNFDAVFINNTARGNVFNTPELREAFEAFMRNGGGLVANHSVTVTSEDWETFGEILGARGASHREIDEKIFVKLDDPSNPVNRVWEGKGFPWNDSIFRFKASPRTKVHVLLSIDVAKTDMNQGKCSGNCVSEDGEYPLAWLRRYGKGRVFYFSPGENPPGYESSFWHPKWLQFYLAGIQYALGDLEADDSPTVRPAAGR